MKRGPATALGVIVAAILVVSALFVDSTTGLRAVIIATAIVMVPLTRGLAQ